MTLQITGVSPNFILNILHDINITNKEEFAKFYSPKVSDEKFAKVFLH